MKLSRKKIAIAIGLLQEKRIPYKSSVLGTRLQTRMNPYHPLVWVTVIILLLPVFVYHGYRGCVDHIFDKSSFTF